jgi:hypothetical protein
MITAYAPGARGHSERFYHTLQDRLPKELALAGITYSKDANRFLRRDYMKQFFFEAITLCMIGGVICIAIARIVSAFTSKAYGWPIVIQPTMMLIRFLFSQVVGVFCGYYPAKKASRLNPIEALYFE